MRPTPDRRNTPDSSGPDRDRLGCTVIAVLGLLFAVFGVFVGLLNWLSPFQPVRNSPIESIIEEGEGQLEEGIPNPLAEGDGLIWSVIIYGNKELKEPIILRSTIQGARNGLRVDWGVSPPYDEMPSDHFSALFSTTHHFLTSSYCFVFEDLDDGARIIIDGEEVRSFWWGFTPGAIYKTPVVLEEGPHSIALVYYEEYENASFHFFWYENAGSECVTVGHPGIQ